jgi:hypothetical protein
MADLVKGPLQSGHHVRNTSQANVGLLRREHDPGLEPGFATTLAGLGHLFSVVGIMAEAKALAG